MEKDAVDGDRAEVPARIPVWVKDRVEARVSDEWAVPVLLEPAAPVSAQRVDTRSPMSGDCHVSIESAPSAGV